MLNRYAMITDSLFTKNSPSSHVVPSIQVSTAHALAQYLSHDMKQMAKRQESYCKALAGLQKGLMIINIEICILKLTTFYRLEYFRNIPCYSKRKNRKIKIRKI